MQSHRGAVVHSMNYSYVLELATSEGMLLNGSSSWSFVLIDIIQHSDSCQAFQGIIKVLYVRQSPFFSVGLLSSESSKLCLVRTLMSAFV